MRDTAEISVIVPAYNIEKYLAECLESIVSQTFKNFECIIVNDGSTDGTQLIAERFTKKDKRFRLVNKKNGGLSSARNAGYDEAKGTYVIFLDGDDFFSPKLLGKLHAKAIKYDADITVCNYKLFFENMKKYSDSKIDFSALKSDEVFSAETKPVEIFSTPLFMVWNKLFKTEFLNEHSIRHNEASHRAEDIDFSGRALADANKVTFVDDALSFYRTGNDSSNVSTSYRYPFDVVWSLEGLKKYLDKKDMYIRVEKSFLRMAASHILGSLYFTELYPVHQELFDKAKKFFRTTNILEANESDFENKKDYKEIIKLLNSDYTEWLRYRISDLRDDGESKYISYLLSEFQRKYNEEVSKYTRVKSEYDAVVTSLSWRVTRPLRRTMRAVRRITR